MTFTCVPYPFLHVSGLTHRAERANVVETLHRLGSATAEIARRHDFAEKRRAERLAPVVKRRQALTDRPAVCVGLEPTDPSDWIPILP